MLYAAVLFHRLLNRHIFMPSPLYIHVVDQPCLCLCFGFSQMIMMLPFLLITLHFSQIGFTDDLTFMLFLLSRNIHSLLKPVYPVLNEVTFAISSAPKKGIMQHVKFGHSNTPANTRLTLYLSTFQNATSIFYLSLQIIRPLERS